LITSQTSQIATGHQLTLMMTVLSGCYMTSCYIILGRNSPKLIYGNHGNDALKALIGPSQRSPFVRHIAVDTNYALKQQSSIDL
jgi:hypothetical protein